MTQNASKDGKTYAIIAYITIFGTIFYFEQIKTLKIWAKIQ